LLDAIDLPVVGVGAKERINVLALRDWIWAYQPYDAAIDERKRCPTGLAPGSSTSLHGRT
jgi:hypothetical protein